MKNSTKRLLSFALAGTIISGVPTTIAHAEGRNTGIVIEEVDKDITYTVHSGDTLSEISVMFFGTSKYYEEIAKYNNIEDALWIYEGQVIKIPRSLNSLLVETYPREFAPDTVYTVEKGDYLLKIVGELYDSESILDVNKLATYNNLEDPNIIYEGQELLIPEKDKLAIIVPNDYTLQYQMLEWRISHPGQPYPYNQGIVITEGEVVQEEGQALVLKP